MVAYYGIRIVVLIKKRMFQKISVTTKGIVYLTSLVPIRVTECNVCSKYEVKMY